MSSQKTSGRFMVRTSPALHAELRRLAAEQNISLNALIVSLLAGGIGFKLKG